MAKYDLTNVTPFNEQPLYKQGFEDAIDAACGWLRGYIGLDASLRYLSITHLLEDFRKAMEK